MTTYLLKSVVGLTLTAVAMSFPFVASARSFCDQYASQAVQAERTNQSLGCGFRGTPTWHSDIRRHRNWCRVASRDQATRLATHRERKIQSCAASRIGRVRPIQPSGPRNTNARRPQPVRAKPVLDVSVDELKFTRSGRDTGRTRTQLSASIRYRVRNNGAADFVLDKAPSGNRLNGGRNRTYFVKLTGFDVVNGRRLFVLEDRLSNAVRTGVLSRGSSGTVQRTLFPNAQRTGQIMVRQIPHNIRDIRVTAEIVLNVDRCYSMARSTQNFSWTWLTRSARNGHQGVYVPFSKGRSASRSTFNYSTQTRCPSYIM